MKLLQRLLSLFTKPEKGLAHHYLEKGYSPKKIRRIALFGNEVYPGDNYYEL